MNKIGLSIVFIFIFALSTFLVEPIQGSEPEMFWSKTYYGDSGRAVQTSDGGYAIGASNASIFYPATQRAPEIIKTDSSGNVQWNKTFNFVGLVAVSSIFQTQDGGFVLAGANISGPVITPRYNGWIIKTESNGNVQWTRSMDSWQTCQAIEISDNSYYLAGYLEKSPGNSESVVTKLENNGDVTWTKAYGDSNTLLVCIAVSENDFVLAGTSNHDGWLSKIDANGNQLWSQTYHPNGYSTFPILSVAQTNDGFVLAGGNIDVTFLLKTDTNGNLVWCKSYSQANLFHTAAQMPDGSILAAGNYHGQACIVNVDSSGSFLSNTTYGETNANSIALSAQVANDGNLIVAGVLDRIIPKTAEGYQIIPSVDKNVWLAKIDVGSVSTPEFPELTLTLLIVLGVVTVTVIFSKKMPNHKNEAFV